MIVLFQMAVLFVAIHLIPHVCFRRIKPPTFAEKLYFALAHASWNVAILGAVVLSLNSGNLLPVPLVATLLFVLSFLLSRVLVVKPMLLAYLSDNKELVDCMEQKALLHSQLMDVYRELSEIEAHQKRHSKSEVQ